MSGQQVPRPTQVGWQEHGGPRSPQRREQLCWASRGEDPESRSPAGAGLASHVYFPERSMPRRMQPGIVLTTTWTRWKPGGPGGWGSS